MSRNIYIKGQIEGSSVQIIARSPVYYSVSIVLTMSYNGALYSNLWKIIFINW
jgi:hypothetical protein